MNGVSMDAQPERIRAWCLANDYELVELFEDEAISGKKSENRPGLLAALDAVCASKGALIVYSLSRLARNTKETIAISERLDRAGADLISLSEKIDTTSAAGKMVFRMLAVLSEFERDVIVERTCMGMAHLRRQCKRISGKIPFGFDLAGDGETLTKNEVEAATLNRIVTEHIAGHSLRKIAAQLNADIIPSKHGGKWGASSIQSILRANAKRRAG
jgi:DNA invertase Pin-like site-specific DNA recombinase